MSFPVWNYDPSWNKITSSYFKDTIDLSGNFIIRNGRIRSPANEIQFDDTYAFTNFVNSVNVLGQLKNTYNSVEYDVGFQCQKVDTLVSAVATLSPIVSDTQFKTTGFYWDSGLSTTVFNNNASFPNVDFTGNINSFTKTQFDNAINYSKSATSDLQTQINNFTGVSLSANNTFTGTNIFNETLRLNNNLRLQGALLVDNGGTTITNTTLKNLQYLANITSDINTSISNLNTKLTNIAFAGVTTSFGGILSFPLNSIQSSSISNLSFVALTGTQSAGGQKTWTGLNIFSSNIRLDTGSLILNTNTLTLTNANLQKIQFLSTVSSDIQTQINNFTGVSLAASNVFTGASNQFSNTLRLDGSLVLNTNTLTLTNANLQKIQYLSTVSSDIQTQTTTNATNITSANTNITTLTNKLTDVSYASSITTVVNTLASSTLTFSSTLNNISTTVFGYLSNLTENIKTSLDNLSTRIATVEIVGTIIMSPLNDLQTTTSNKYLMCSGQAVSRTTYSSLFAKFGTLFGVGNGTTTFNLPNYNGMFLRGMGNQIINGTNYGNYNSTYAPDPDSIQNHTHSGQAGAYLGTNNTIQSIGYMASMNYAPASYSFTNTGNMSSGRINDFETKPVSIGIYYYVRT